MSVAAGLDGPPLDVGLMRGQEKSVISRDADAIPLFGLLGALATVGKHRLGLDDHD